jgi:alkanesulfonate monooxygenase SsuD/methylene tetrahydromethanopterin reductase-like flavin-dependent oxidoreductase (luciferase family)
MGYRPEEYHAMNKDWAMRGALMDEVIELLLKAWSGEEFSYRGTPVKIRPIPLSKPHPFFFIGGMSKAAARRAAKFGLPFYPPMFMPELEELYYSELKKHGNTGFVYYPKEGNSMLFIDEDPERAWQELASYFLNETREYGSWKRDDTKRPSEDNITTIDGLRSQKRFEIVTPQQCLDRLQQNENYTVVCHPLVGGLPIEQSWHYLRNFIEKVWVPHTRNS